MVENRHNTKHSMRILHPPTSNLQPPTSSLFLLRLCRVREGGQCWFPSACGTGHEPRPSGIGRTIAVGCTWLLPDGNGSFLLLLQSSVTPAVMVLTLECHPPYDSPTPFPLNSMWCRMSVRKTIKWLVLIVVVIGVAGGGFGYWKWSTLNRELLRTVREQFAEVAPGWNIQVESARFDWHRRIHLYNLSLQSSDGSPLLRIPEVILVVDQDKLADSQIFDVQRIRILRPELHLTRDAQGTWNWEKLPRMKKASKPTQILPEIVVEAATVQVRLKQADGNPDSVIELKQGSLKLVPKSRRQFLVQGDIAVRDAGQFTVNGDSHLHTGEWSFDGRMQNIDASGDKAVIK